MRYYLVTAKKYLLTIFIMEAHYEFTPPVRTYDRRHATQRLFTTHARVIHNDTMISHPILLRKKKFDSTFCIGRMSIKGIGPPAALPSVASSSSMKPRSSGIGPSSDWHDPNESINYRSYSAKRRYVCGTHAPQP